MYVDVYGRSSFTGRSTIKDNSLFEVDNKGITGRFEVRRAYKYSAESTAQHSRVLLGSLENKYANL